jgi:uncharacterized membrane protein
MIVVIPLMAISTYIGYREVFEDRLTVPPAEA